MKPVISCLLTAAFIIIACYPGCSHRETVYYVSPSGNDAWSGRLPEPNGSETDGPFATLRQARTAVRALKQKGGLPDGGVTVSIRGGFYTLTEPFRLTAEDSGDETSPVIWRAFPGETVQVVGGRPVTGFRPVDDPAILKRLDETARGFVLTADLRAQDITDYGAITNRGGPGMELFFMNRRMTLARWPNEGWSRIADVPQTGMLVFEGVKPHMRHGRYVGRHYGRFTYEGDRPKQWSSDNEIFLHGYWSWDWYDEYLKVKSIDTKRREISIAEPHSGYGYCTDQRYYALNILEELDMPGEWYLDRTRGILYFWPPGSIDDGTAFVSILEEPLITLENTSYVTVAGLNLEFSRGGGIVVEGGSHNLIAGCTLRNLGALAAAINGGTDNGITSCDISDVAAGGVSLNGGDRKTLIPGGNFAVNNHIHDYSSWIRTYQSAITVSGVGNRIAHNLIHDAPHSGIILSGNEHIIEFNELHTLAQQTGDVGAFYMGRDWTQRGNIIRHNYFHDLLGPGLHGVMAVYLDDWSSGTTIYGNVFYRAGRAAFIGGGRDNVVENNIFVECAPSTHVDARGLGWAKYYFDGTTNTLFEHMDAMSYSKPPYSERYPELLKLYDDEPAVPKYNRIVRNVSYGGRWFDLYDGMDFTVVTVKDNLIADPDLCKWFRKGAEDFVTYKYGDPEIMKELQGNTIIDADPGFADLKNGDFGLRFDSPAFKLGFKPIPFDKIGLYKDEYRTALPSVAVRSGKPELTPPVFFSYAWPIGPETNRDFKTIDMNVITIIDIGPDSLSYPPTIRNRYPPEIFDLWHKKGKLLVRRCYDRPFGPDNKKIDMDSVTVDDLVSRWSHSMEEPGVNGISIDEFIRDDPRFVSVLIEALRTVRAKYPDKLICCWIAGKGLNPENLHAAIRDCADFCMPEIYYRESAAKGFPDFEFTRFREAVDTLERNAPGLSGKILPGVGVNESLFDDDPSIDYGVFIEAQLRTIVSDPVLKKLPGLAFYAPMKLSQKNIRLLDGLVRKYFKKTD